MFSNLFHMELIRYCKNRSTMIAIIATLFLFAFTFILYRTEIAVVLGYSSDLSTDADIRHVLQAFTVQSLTSTFAFCMGLSVIFTTTAFYKNRFYYNVNGVIRSRFKLFVADVMVLFSVAAAATAAIIFYSLCTGRYIDKNWLYDRTDTGVEFCILFVFCRIFFCMLGAYALSHILRRASVVIAGAVAIQVLQGALFMAIAIYLMEVFNVESGNPIASVTASLIAPSQAYLYFASGDYRLMTPVSILATTAVPFAIIFIVAAVAAGRRIEV